MKELELLGKHCRDIVSGLEGICIGVVEWMYGCRQFVLQPKAEDGMKRHYSSFYFEKQLEVLDDGVTDKVEIPEYRPQQYFWKECRDKVTGVVGMCITEMELQYRKHVEYADTKNRSLESQAETMRLSILGKDSKVKDVKPLEVVDVYIRENTMEIIDPLDSQKKVQELRDRINTLLTELDTQIKVSNATTTIEF